MCANDCQIAALVFWRVFLFVGIFVFLIYDDETRVRQRSEDCGTGADNYLGLPFSDAVPLVEPFSLGEM